MLRLTPDLCVIGAGAAGLSVAAGAVQMGASVVLVEKGRMGGDCLNAGCIPSKALLAAAARVKSPTDSPGQDDYAAAMAHVAATIAAIAPTDSQERFERLGCTVVRAPARFVSPREVVAGDTAIEARRFVIATGSTPAVPPVPGLDAVPYLTSETLFKLRERPEHLLILGSGPTGLEMAQAHRRLGSAVTVIEADRALGRDDPGAARVVLEALRAEGVAIHEETKASLVSGRAGAITVHAGDERFEGSHLLVATGRKATIEGLGLDVAGIEADIVIRTDRRLRTTNPRVFAIGDVTGRWQLTHVANYHAGLVIRQALFALPARLSDAAVPRATYTDPELAQVGLTETEARAAHGARLTVIGAPFAENDRAAAGGETRGFCKVMVVRGRPVGATIVGANAGELIGLWTLAIAERTKISAVAGMIMPYPTLSEVSKRAAGTYFSARLFGNPRIGRVVRLAQRWLP